MPRVKPPSSMNDRRMSELLQAGIPLCLPDGLKPDSNPFLQSITDESIEPMSIGTLKSEWMKRELERVEEEFLERRECLVMAGSWNVNGTLQPGPIEAWLTSKSVPDIVFIGLQEVDTSTQAYIYDGAQKEKFWNETLFLALQSSHPDTPFRLLVSRLYVGVYGALFVQEEILPYIDHVATSIAACGLMGMVGNKGAVGMRFRFHTDYFCFISSHLAAHIPAVERRNQDAWEISRRTLFNAPYVRTEAHNIIDRMMNDFRANPGPAGIWDANCIIWAGDLNYRVPLDATLVRDLLDVGLYKDLLAHDQLVKERTEGRTIWRHFNEAPIDFLPTFKYDPGTSVFDSSEKNRTPAWCDRILYRSKNPIEALEYTSVPKLVASDHKPVRGLFRTEARYIVRSRFEECHARLLAQMDKLENELIPATTLQTHMIDFGQLVYRRLVKYSTAILNVGQVICQFRAIPPNPEAFSAPCAPWIRIKPQHGILMPGESRDISFFFYVDSQTGPSLNLQPDRLEDIVVIHVDGGRDHFVHLSGSFRRTPFCQPLSEACAYETSLGDDKRYRRIPETVWRLVDFIIHHGIETVKICVSWFIF